MYIFFLDSQSIDIQYNTTLIFTLEQFFKDLKAQRAIIQILHPCGVYTRNNFNVNGLTQMLTLLLVLPGLVTHCLK